MSERRLFYTVGSPYARAVRIVLQEKQLPCQAIVDDGSFTLEDRLRITPTLQVPALIEQGRTLWDSAVILEYLTEHYATPAAGPDQPPYAEHFIRPDHALEDRRLTASLQTLTASVATVSQLQWSGVRHEDNDFAGRNAARLQTLLHWCESQLPDDGGGFLPGVVSAQDVMLATTLMFVDHRPLRLTWRRAERPRIAALHDRLAARQSFRDNPIVWWQPDA